MIYPPDDFPVQQVRESWGNFCWVRVVVVSVWFWFVGFWFVVVSKNRQSFMQEWFLKTLSSSSRYYVMAAANQVLGIRIRTYSQIKLLEFHRRIFIFYFEFGQNL